MRTAFQHGYRRAWLSGFAGVVILLQFLHFVNLHDRAWEEDTLGEALVLHRRDPASPIVNATHQDSVGNSQIVAWKDGRIEFELFGFGTAETTQNLLNDCGKAMDQIDSSIKCSVLVDMRNGIGCSPLAIPCIVRFVRKKSYRLQHVAVLGPRPLMAIARTICKRSKLTGVAFFADRDDAEKWCVEVPDSQ
eukprot:Skav221224  [mRNA]  locus=scaffold2467:272415:272987:- [translate_table: standard]